MIKKWGLFLICMIMAACIPGGPRPASAAPYQVNIGISGKGSTYYPIGHALAQIWETKLDGRVRASAQVAESTPRSIELMMHNEMQVVLGHSTICYSAFHATDAYKDKPGFPYKNLRGMLTLFPSAMQWVARKNAGIRSIADLKGKRIAPGHIASATEIHSRIILGAFGLNYIGSQGALTVAAEYRAYGEAADLLKKGQIDAAHIPAGIPTAAVTDLLSSDAGMLLSIDADKIKAICDQYPWYFPLTIPAGTYPKQDRDVHTIALASLVFTDAKMPDELVYMLTKSIYDYHADLVHAHRAAEYTVIANAFNGMTIPLHPGAIKYFEEKGVAVPDSLRPPAQ